MSIRTFTTIIRLNIVGIFAPTKGRTVSNYLRLDRSIYSVLLTRLRRVSVTCNRRGKST